MKKKVIITVTYIHSTLVLNISGGARTADQQLLLFSIWLRYALMLTEKNEVIQTKIVVTTAVDAVALLGRVNNMVTKDRKGRLRSALSVDVKDLCDKNYDESQNLLGDNLADKRKQGKHIR